MEIIISHEILVFGEGMYNSSIFYRYFRILDYLRDKIAAAAKKWPEKL